MKLNKLLREAVPGQATNPAVLSPGLSTQDPNVPSEEDLPSPLGARVPKTKRIMNPTEHKFRYDIEQEYLKSKEAENQADTAMASGDAVNAVQMLKDALHRYHEVTDRHVMSGLRQKSFERQRGLPKQRHEMGQFSGYFVLAADIDNFKWVNSTMTHAGADRVLYEIGELFDKNFESNPKLKGRVKAYHAHGDELAVFAYALDAEGNILTYDQCRAIVVEMINGAKSVTTELAQTGWAVPGRKVGVQVTITWALSTTYELADDMLMRVKGESDKTRYLLVVDETIAQHYQLPAVQGLLDPLANFQVKTTEPTIKPMLPKQAPEQSQVQQTQSEPSGQDIGVSGATMTEETKQPNQKDELEFLETHQGMAFLQCNPYKFSEDDRKIIEKTRQKQLTYLKDSQHVHPLTGAKLDSPYTNFQSKAKKSAKS